MPSDKTPHTFRRTRPTSATVTPVTPTVPDNIRAFLGNPPLTPSENADAYEELLARIATAVAPKDAIEWIYVRDVCDLVWESRRLRQSKADIVKLATASMLEEMLSTPGARMGHTLLPEELQDDDLDRPEKQRIAGWLAGDTAARAEVDDLLKACGYTVSFVEAQAHLERLDDIERLDRLITIYDGRRDAILRDLDRRRAAVAARLRSVSDALIDESSS